MLKDAILCWNNNRAWCIKFLLSVLGLSCVIWLLMWLVIFRPLIPQPTQPEFTVTMSNPNIVTREDDTVTMTVVTREEAEASAIETRKKTTQLRAAIARALTIDQSCYDEAMDTWFIHSYNIETDDSPDDLWSEGWYYSVGTNIEYTVLGNGTYMLTNTDPIFNDKVQPDITGLQCEIHLPHK